MPHVGIERLGTCHGEHDRPECQKSLPPVSHKELEGIIWIERTEDDFGHFHDFHHAKDSDGRKIGDHDGAKQRTDLCRAARLNHEKANQDDDRKRNHVGRETGIDDNETFRRRKHRHGRCNHAVAIEQRRCKDTQHDNRCRPSFAFGHAVDQCEECEAAAFPLVISAHDDGHIFERDDDHHRPEDQAENTVDVQRIGRENMMPGESFAECINRACADVAEDDSDRSDDQFGSAAVDMMALAVLVVMRGDSGLRRRHKAGNQPFVKSAYNRI